jgi:hypothetical protein
MFNRDRIVEELINEDVHCIRISNQDAGMLLLQEYLRNGFKGYALFTDEELIEECEARDISYLFADNDD